MAKRLAVLLGGLVLISVVGALVAIPALAQTPTPTAEAKPLAPFGGGRGNWFGLGGGSTAVFDAVAGALDLTPTQLFEQLHGGKSLSEISEAQGVDLQTIKDAADAARTQATKDAINQAVEDGTMSRAQADWLLQGLEQGYLPGRGFGRGMRGGLFGFGLRAPEGATSQPQGTQS